MAITRATLGGNPIIAILTRGNPGSNLVVGLVINISCGSYTYGSFYFVRCEAIGKGRAVMRPAIEVSS